MRFSHHWFVLKIRSVTQAVTYAHGDHQTRQQSWSSILAQEAYRNQMLPHEEADFSESGAVSADMQIAGATCVLINATFIVIVLRLLVY